MVGGPFNVQPDNALVRFRSGQLNWRRRTSELAVRNVLPLGWRLFFWILKVEIVTWLQVNECIECIECVTSTNPNRNTSNRSARCGCPWTHSSLCIINPVYSSIRSSLPLQHVIVAGFLLLHWLQCANVAAISSTCVTGKWHSAHTIAGEDNAILVIQ